ncbi:MAG: DUF3822 family protein [Chitinophagales bacterium]
MAQVNPSKYYLEVLLNNELHLYAPLDSGVQNWEISQKERDKQLSKIAELVNKKTVELHILFQPLCFSLVPEILFEASEAPLYLDLHHSDISNSFITFESLNFAAIELVYAIPKKTAQVFRQKFENAFWHCRPKALLQYIAEKSFENEDISMWVAGDSNELMIALYKKGRLLFYNTFQTDSETDQLYYCLALAEQQGIDKQSCHLHLLGENTSNELKTALKKQFAHTREQVSISRDKINSSFIYLEAMHLCAS